MILLFISTFIGALVAVGIWYKNNIRVAREVITDDKKPHFIDVSHLQPTAQMLDENRYWTIINQSLPFADDQLRQEQSIIEAISKLTPTEMISFALRSDQVAYDAYTSGLWCAAYIIKGKCSDDEFGYFRNWLISRGRDVYDRAKADPDILVTEANETYGEWCDFQDIWYLAVLAFKNVTGEKLYQYIDYDNVAISEGDHPAITFNWQKDDPESMKRICPNLFDKFWHLHKPE